MGVLSVAVVPEVVAGAIAGDGVASEEDVSAMAIVLLLSVAATTSK